ncbi:short chain dehydrogenase/reductase SDR [Pyrenophora tritici-repentis Pt-1C-BFP]|uniref:Short chain dehydrogenase/reductase SDR n=1 Tax=Pyrenophora tritici-repentis (strain Pt-1C-BFP) TaxID=426418 RepID=B2W6B1_PYRTR|nr:short chain dehydrogenase/reductase SDR [Pyrenophora tritici-repentis Pt-1C-BFP]EDU48269.1 short chain dehydrogenase/reductase SDR [Pyrenophora tritici-repentis Pt-1C-BFP]
MPPWSLISPASRGIGFALARRVLQTTHTPVIATARKDLDRTKEELLDGLGVDEGRLTVLKLDVLVKTFDNHLRTASTNNAMAVALHPGTVKTGLSKDFWSNVKKEKLFERDWVAERLIDVIKQVGIEGRGKCWDWDGKEVPP